MNEEFLKKITILVAEDQVNDAELLLSTLKKYFKKILLAKDGLEALKIYKENKDIDIIISDIDMPKMNGIELLKSIRYSDLYIPFIIVSGKIENEVLMEAINQNVSSYILKPLDIKILLEKIDILCEKKYFEHRLEQKQEELDNYLSSIEKVAVVFKLKRDGTITYMNESMFEVSGYKKEDLNILNFDDIIHPDIPKKYIDDTWEIVSQGKLWTGNTKFISKSKETFYLKNTIFKTSSVDDEYITIAFLTTKENIEKRDFHKKVLLSIKEFNLKEYRYKEEIKALRAELSSINLTGFESKLASMRQKNSSYEAQLKKYENEIEELNEKYKEMLLTKKTEISRYVDLIQIEKNKNAKLEEEREKLLEERKILKEINERLEKK